MAGAVDALIFLMFAYGNPQRADVYVFVYMHICISIHAYVHVCMHAPIHAYIPYINLHAYVHTAIYIQKFKFKYTY
jgi:hypothetical protein